MRQLYAFVIFGLIFNTVFSLYYALGKRFSAGSDKRYKFFVAAFALAGFAISFMGFRQLVAVMYPIIGYLGLLMLVVLVVASYRKKGGIRKEKEIRNHLLGIVEKAYDSE
ncbi:MAG: branched-chain amino acid transport system II carrier protein, partial [Streptococcus sp.]